MDARHSFLCNDAGYVVTKVASLEQILMGFSRQPS